jgi:hypothetical protein
MLCYEHIIWYNEQKPCELCGAQTFMAALRDMNKVHLARDAQPQPLCSLHLTNMLPQQDAERVEQDLKWLACTTLSLQTTSDLNKDGWETGLRVLRMNYTLLWLWHKGLKDEAQQYRSMLEHDPAFDQQTHLSITYGAADQEPVPQGTSITLNAPASIAHGKVLTTLLDALRTGSALSEDIFVVVSPEMQRVDLPADSSLHNAFV